MSTLVIHVGYVAMKYAIDEAADGPRFQTGGFTQRVGPLAGEHRDDDADEVVYVLEGTGRVTVGGEAHGVRPGVAVFVSRGTPWSAEGDARGVSVLIHEPDPSTGHAVLDLERIERSATVEWEGNVARGHGTITADTGAFSALPFTLPSRIGDPEGKTSPEELLAAATAGCFTMSLGSELVRDGTPPGRLEVQCR